MCAAFFGTGTLKHMEQPAWELCSPKLYKGYVGSHGGRHWRADGSATRVPQEVQRRHVGRGQSGLKHSGYCFSVRTGPPLSLHIFPWNSIPGMQQGPGKRFNGGLPGEVAASILSKKGHSRVPWSHVGLLFHGLLEVDYSI